MGSKTAALRSFRVPHPPGVTIRVSVKRVGSSWGIRAVAFKKKPFTRSKAVVGEGWIATSENGVPFYLTRSHKKQHEKIIDEAIKALDKPVEQADSGTGEGTDELRKAYDKKVKEAERIQQAGQAKLVKGIKFRITPESFPGVEKDAEMETTFVIAPNERRKKKNIRVVRVPTGLTAREPIRMRWFKPIDAYPQSLKIRNQTYSMHARKGLPAPDQDYEIGGLGWLPARNKILERRRTPDGGEKGSFARKLLRHGYHAFGRGQDIDHVRDLDWGGPDDRTNLWPLNSSINRSAGSSQNRHQPVTYADPSGRLHRDVRIENVPATRRFFKITTIKR